MHNFLIRFIEKVSDFLLLQPVSAWLVGGTVRDLLLGRDLADVDLAVKAERELVRELAVFLNAKVVEFSYPYVLRLVVREGNCVFNIDVDLLEEKDIVEDLETRDFTIDAMALPITGRVLDFDSLVDPWGGRRDLDNRFIRAVRNDVFARDPIRILRAYRLAKVLDFGLEKDTRELIGKWGKIVEWREVSGERIWNELAKILGCDYAAEVLQDLEREGILGRILGVFPDRLQVDMVKAFERIEADSSLFKELFKQLSVGKRKNVYPVFKLGLLLYDVINKAEAVKVCDFLRLARWERDLVLNIVEPAEDIFIAGGEEEKVGWKRLIYRYKGSAPDLLLADLVKRIAEEKRRDKVYDYIDYAVRFLEFYIMEGKNWLNLPRYIDGKQVAEILGIKPSPLVGEILQMAAEKEIKGEIINEKQAECWMRSLLADNGLKR